jgi:hypothetical protein
MMFGFFVVNQDVIAARTQKTLAALAVTQLKKLAQDRAIDSGRIVSARPDDTAGSLPSYSSEMRP